MNRVLVFGDIMLDTWQKTVPSKISSEAPVLVMKHQEFTYSPGGAANAAVNCAHLGSSTTLISLLGEDTKSNLLREVIVANNVGMRYSVRSSVWKTIEKLRIVDELGRHLLRVDTEVPCQELDPHDVAEIYKSFNSVSNVNPEADVLLISDYGKGVCTRSIVEAMISEFVQKEKFVVVNGKPENHLNYTFADVVVLNQHEAQEIGHKWISQWPQLLACVYEAVRAHNLVVTVGSQGLYWFNGFKVVHIPGKEVAVADVAGAGDTVCATIAHFGKCDEEVLKEAVRYASLVVSQRGTSVPGVR